MPNKSYKFIFSHYVWLKPTCHIHKGGLILVSEGSRELTIDLCKQYAIITILTNQRPLDVTTNTLIGPL